MRKTTKAAKADKAAKPDPVADAKPLTEEENIKLAHMTFDEWWTGAVGILGQLADDADRLGREEHLQISPDDLYDVENLLKSALTEVAKLRPRSKYTQMYSPRFGCYR